MSFLWHVWVCMGDTVQRVSMWQESVSEWQMEYLWNVCVLKETKKNVLAAGKDIE